MFNQSQPVPVGRDQHALISRPFPKCSTQQNFCSIPSLACIRVINAHFFHRSSSIAISDVLFGISRQPVYNLFDFCSRPSLSFVISPGVFVPYAGSHFLSFLMPIVLVQSVYDVCHLLGRKLLMA